jgi:hypothetical protein
MSPLMYVIDIDTELVKADYKIDCKMQNDPEKLFVRTPSSSPPDHDLMS